MMERSTEVVGIAASKEIASERLKMVLMPGREALLMSLLLLLLPLTPFAALLMSLLVLLLPLTPFAAVTPRLCSGCENLHFPSDSKRHQPLVFQCLQTMRLFSETFPVTDSAHEGKLGGAGTTTSLTGDLDSVASVLSPSDVEDGAPESKDENATVPNSSASVDSSSSIGSSGLNVRGAARMTDGKPTLLGVVLVAGGATACI
jgi:hypothetical protein